MPKGPIKSQDNKICVIGLVADAERLADIRRNRVAIMRENNIIHCSKILRYGRVVLNSYSVKTLSFNIIKSKV